MKDTSNGRLLSIDAVRGFDMMFIMGLSGIIVALCSLFPGGSDCWLARQMGHVSWDGMSHHDTIFSLFLFISGMTLPFSIARKKDAGQGNASITAGIVRRGLTLFVLGLVYQGLFNLDFATLRIPSVLGRIGIAWMLAALLFLYTGPKTQWAVAAGILIGYFALLGLCLAPDAPAGAGHFSREGNIVSYIDRLLIPNHIYRPGVYDPEGILSTLPAVVTALFGMFTGRYVKDSGDSGSKKAGKMMAVAVLMAVAAIVWNNWFPINKKLWSSSFVLASGAWSLGIFAVFYYLIDVKGWRKGVLFFQVVGMNSITIYMAQRIVNVQSISDFFLGGLAGLLPPAAGTLVLEAGYFAVCWLFLYFLYTKKCFLKV